MSYLQDYIDKYKEKIYEGILDELQKRLIEARGVSPHLVPIIEAMKELSVGGKRLRAMLTILGYELATGKELATSPAREEIVKAAVVMELFHLGLLCQDDVFDRDELRRGVKTIHARYDNLHLGEGLAVMAGDFTFGWGIEILSGLKLSPERVVAGLGIWGKYFTRVGYGEALDVMTEQRGEISEKEMIQVAALKSGEYSCVLPLLLGATLGGSSKELLKSLYEYGMELGWVFQLRDDWLAEYGDSKKTGKPVGNDRREGKKTLGILYGREKLESVIIEHMQKGKVSLRGVSPKYEGIMAELLEWVGTREN